LFAVLLNCPYPDPPVFAFFFPFSSTPQWGEGQPRGPFVVGHSQTITVHILKISGKPNILLLLSITNRLFFYIGGDTPQGHNWTSIMKSLSFLGKILPLNTNFREAEF